MSVAHGKEVFGKSRIQSYYNRTNKDKIVYTSNEIYSWSSVTQIFENGQNH